MSKQNEEITKKYRAALSEIKKREALLSGGSGGPTSS
jgi:hypothetical protein